MTDLTDLRDHCRLMAEREHAPGCPPVRSRPGKVWSGEHKWCQRTDAHDEHEWTEALLGIEWSWTCYGICDGCASDKERALWLQLADEIDEHLAPDDEGPDLFGGGA